MFPFHRSNELIFQVRSDPDHHHKIPQGLILVTLHWMAEILTPTPWAKVGAKNYVIAWIRAMGILMITLTRITR